jgi:exosortase D (VPLPA-CTERM-specific)
MSDTATTARPPFRPTVGVWVVLGIALVAVVLGFRGAIAEMLHTWSTREEYSYGPIIPLLVAFLIWQRHDKLASGSADGTWAGVSLVLAGLLLDVLGRLATLVVLQQVALIVVIYGCVLAATGWRVFRDLWAPLLVLAFMVPLPDFLLFNLSARLQLISSQIGVALIRLFGISVNLEGNVIDLGSYKLQVADACSGLRYLFPLMILGFIATLFYKAPFWKRALVFLSSIPITVLMNSLRIGVIGMTVQHWGTAMAEGFLHEFQGWAVFMASAGLMLLQMALLSRLGPTPSSLRDVLAVDFPARTPSRRSTDDLRISPALLTATALALVGLGAANVLPERAEATPARTSFLRFPEQIAGWSGRSKALEDVYLDTLKLDDYLLADYGASGRTPVNLYMAWYGSQRAGRSAHSPRSCLPGGGWRIEAFDQVTLERVQGPQGPLRVNRALVRLGDQQMIVYYWFQQRGRVITNEYLVKWYLLVDALGRNRTDGAMVRLSAPVPPGASIESAERDLVEFAAQTVPRLRPYIPE